MPVLLVKSIDKLDPALNPDCWFIVEGDEKLGKRPDLKSDNVYAIKTCTSLYSDRGAWNDLYYAENVEKFEDGFGVLERMLHHGAIVFIPFDFAARFHEDCPKTESYINKRVARLIEIHNRKIKMVRREL